MEVDALAPSISRTTPANLLTVSTTRYPTTISSQPRVRECASLSEVHWQALASTASGITGTASGTLPVEVLLC